MMIVLSSQEEEDRYGRDRETLEVTSGVDVTFFLSGERGIEWSTGSVFCVGGIRNEKIKCVWVVIIGQRKHIEKRRDINNQRT